MLSVSMSFRFATCIEKWDPYRPPRIFCPSILSDIQQHDRQPLDSAPSPCPEPVPMHTHPQRKSESLNPSSSTHRRCDRDGQSSCCAGRARAGPSSGADHGARGSS